MEGKTMADALKVAMINDATIEVTRLFNAPARLVWDAHTKPELVQRWLLGPDGWSMPKCEIDLRPGGAYLYGWRHPDGRYFEIGGTYCEVTPYQEIKHIERFNGAESQCVMRLAEARGKTTMTLAMDFGSKQARDRAFATGMTTGMERSYQRLDDIAAEAA
jgi:uncharacterized protein YndB with AHSA1/START domain